ncbi:putative UPF0481 protein [Tanacetum coccineum]|uniref:UPF0481 protein n=1 Tax=Tanacetum coccineum TaxID=301880 RepID=A0ABQ5DH14_9ASTR
MSNSNNKQPLDLTDYDGISQPDEASTTTPIIDPIGFLLGCAKRGENRNDQPPPTICKVSRVLRDLSENSFNPQLVSIGPLHKEDPKLQEFEWMKECYLDDLLKCCNNINSTPEKTLLEACLQKSSSKQEFGFAISMPTFVLPGSDVASKTKSLSCLQALFDCSMGKVFCSLLSDVLDACMGMVPLISSFLVLVAANHNFYLISDSTLIMFWKKGSKNTQAAFHSIVELDRSGMNFKPHQEGGWSMTIKFQSSLFACLPGFWSKPTLLMPTLVIDDATELILRNFIAYEQSFPKDRYYFTSYCTCHDMLLILRRIWLNCLNQKSLYWPKNIARLRRVYFNNPWNAIALVAAIILFSLTVVQTVYAIKGK